MDFPGILMIILSDNCQKVKYHHIYYARHPNRRRILGQFEETSLLIKIMTGSSSPFNFEDSEMEAKIQHKDIILILK